ncbi:MAG: hypothetical protein ACHQDD_02990 [Steroidobacterales bacterium]
MSQNTDQRPRGDRNPPAKEPVQGEGESDIDALAREAAPGSAREARDLSQHPVLELISSPGPLRREG